MIVQELFSKREGDFFSWLIRFATKPLAKKTPFKNIPSHNCIRKGHFVYESTFFSGVRIIPFESWNKVNTIVGVNQRSIPISDSQFEKVFVDIWGKKYDWKGILYFGFSLVRFRLFGKKIPKVNKWNDRNKYFCSEASGKLFGIDYQMTAPVQILEKDCPDN